MEIAKSKRHDLWAVPSVLPCLSSGECKRIVSRLRSPWNPIVQPGEISNWFRLGYVRPGRTGFHCILHHQVDRSAFCLHYTTCWLPFDCSFSCKSFKLRICINYDILSRTEPMLLFFILYINTGLYLRIYLEQFWSRQKTGRVNYSKK